MFILLRLVADDTSDQIVLPNEHPEAVSELDFEKRPFAVASALLRKAIYCEVRLTVARQRLAVARHLGAEDPIRSLPLIMSSSLDHLGLAVGLGTCFG